MNIINIEHISKRFGDKFLFEDASFGVQEGDKMGLSESMEPESRRFFR